MTDEQELRSNLLEADAKRIRLSEEYDRADEEYEKAWDALAAWEKKNSPWTSATVRHAG